MKQSIDFLTSLIGQTLLCVIITAIIICVIFFSLGIWLIGFFDFFANIISEAL